MTPREAISLALKWGEYQVRYQQHLAARQQHRTVNWAIVAATVAFTIGVCLGRWLR
jgi:hypothetical protein